MEVRSLKLGAVLFTTVLAMATGIAASTAFAPMANAAEATVGEMTLDPSQPGFSGAIRIFTRTSRSTPAPSA
jgi:hypothetical protein